MKDEHTRWTKLELGKKFPITELRMRSKRMKTMTQLGTTDSKLARHSKASVHNGNTLKNSNYSYKSIIIVNT